MPKTSNVRERRPLAEQVECRVMLSSTQAVVDGPLVPVTAPVAAMASKLTPSGKSAHAAAKPSVRVGTPSSVTTPAVNGLTGAYYVNGYKQFVFTRTDDNIDFIWRAGSAPDPTMVGKAFAVRWTGQIVAQYSEVYTFHTVADDGVRLWVGGKLVINDWQDQPATHAGGRIRLEAGQAYDIRVDYYENGDPPAAIRLLWSSASQPKQVIPASAFLTAGQQATPAVGSAPVAPAAPVTLSATAESETKISLAWNDVAGETGFVVQRSPDGAANWTTINVLGSGQTRFDDTGLSAGTTYFYRVLATGAAGASDGSNVASATTAALVSLPQPFPTPLPVVPPLPPVTHRVYALTNDGKVESIDTTDASATQVGTLMFGTSAGDRDPLTGKFYYIDQNTSTPRVAVWDPATDTNTFLGATTVSGPVMRAAFRADGTLFITANNGDLYTIDRLSGAATLVGALKANGTPLSAPSGDISFSPDGTLYLDENSAVYTIDLGTLNAAYVGDNGNLGNVQISFGSDGVLYGTVGTGDLYTINLTTGAATLVGNTGVLQIGDLASAPA